MKSKPGKEGRVVREPAPAAAAERQRLVRDARCARVSSASSAPTPAPRGAFPLVRHQCHHQFAPPGASPGVNWRGPAQAYIVTTPVSCSLTDCQSQFAPDPCLLLWQEDQLSCNTTTVKVLETSKSSNQQKRTLDRQDQSNTWTGKTSDNQKMKMKETIVNILR